MEVIERYKSTITGIRERLNEIEQQQVNVPSRGKNQLEKDEALRYAVDVARLCTEGDNT